MIRAADKWLAGYLASVWRRRGGGRGGHLVFCVADHFEPFGGGADRSVALERVKRWAQVYPAVCGRFRDDDGRPPRHTFFYPGEAYEPEVIDRILPLVRGGFGEVEVHLHHRHDTRDGFREKLVRFRDVLHGAHGCLGVAGDGTPRYGFVHGNWALCNARPDGDWCGVNEELGVLSETGCYADYTFPSAPSPTQPRRVNAIYRAMDTGKPRAADDGVRVTTGGRDRGGLMIVQGPLALDWRRRKCGVLPRLENGELSGVNPPTGGRAALWMRQAVGVSGQPDWIFVKVHTHGCVDANAAVLLGDSMAAFHEALARKCGEVRCRLHYATAREMFNMIRAAEDGEVGSPGAFRDFEVRAPAAAAPA